MARRRRKKKTPTIPLITRIRAELEFQGVNATVVLRPFGRGYDICFERDVTGMRCVRGMWHVGQSNKRPTRSLAEACETVAHMFDAIDTFRYE